MWSTCSAERGKCIAFSTAPPVRAAAPIPTRALPAMTPATAPPATQIHTTSMQFWTVLEIEVQVHPMMVLAHLCMHIQYRHLRQQWQKKADAKQ